MFLNSILIILTEACNLSCRYCYLNKKRYPGQLLDKKLKKALDIFFYFPPQDKNIIFSGGEPLLNFKLLKRAIVYLRRKEKKEKRLVNISLLTNGLLLSQAKINFLLSQKVKIVVSLDGPKLVNDQNRIFANRINKSCFDKVMKNLMVAPNSQFGVSLVFNRRNFKTLPQNIAFLSSLRKFDQIDFYPKFQEIWSKKEINELTRIFKQLGLRYERFFDGKGRPVPFKIPAFYAFLHQSYLFKGAACSKILLGSDSQFYLACFSFFCLPWSERKKYQVGDTETGINFVKRLEYLNAAEKKVGQAIKFFSPQERLTQPFCFFNAYYYSHFAQKNLRRYLNTIQKISQIYRTLFLSLKEKLMGNKKFRRLYQL